ncbi:hypothetical protein RI129_007833 [Pyrocoelia pectoralis]|uniref:THAP-type domain-containing protein n=1 Tax=Pyrocoelia pectoralis TaxID=417401 RepID=A0AAN7ZLU5_9COLE
MEPSKRCYKWCFVPMCTNTTFTIPEKTFLTMPRDVKIRQMWFKAARRDYSKITCSDFYCCEDHFDARQCSSLGYYVIFFLGGFKGSCAGVQIFSYATEKNTIINRNLQKKSDPDVSTLEANHERRRQRKYVVEKLRKIENKPKSKSANTVRSPPENEHRQTNKTKKYSVYL